jgi:hypothetical protein
MTMEVKTTEKRRARARLVSCAMFDDPLVIGLDPQLQGMLLWVALIVSADTTGRSEGSPIVLLNTILSELREADWSAEVVEGLLKQMAKARDAGDGKGPRSLIRWYKTGRKLHVELIGWNNTQHFTRPTVSERPAPRADDALALLQQRIATEIPTSVHNLHALAARMWNEGVHDAEQVLEAVRAIHKQGSRIHNPWAYIQSKGLLSTSKSRGLEAKAARDKEEEERGGTAGIASVLAQLAKKGAVNGGP